MGEVFVDTHCIVCTDNTRTRGVRIDTQLNVGELRYELRELENTGVKAKDPIHPAPHLPF
jgi:hypothetical protein